jgi:hypothetical protein
LYQYIKIDEDSSRALILWRNPQQTGYRPCKLTAKAAILGGIGLAFVNHKPEQTMRKGGRPVVHPLLGSLFSDFENGRYRRQFRPN